MVKAFFYDNVEGELHRCMFVGVDKEGKPMWLRICQGDVVMELREYEELFAKEELLLLCMEGEKVESATLAAFLGARLQSYAWNIRSNLIKGLEKLKRWNVSWHHDNLELSVIVTKYYEDLKSKDCYMFELSNEQGGSICMMDAFETMDQLMDTVRQYFAVVEFSANIPILIRRLVCSDDLLAEISEEDREMFDN